MMVTPPPRAERRATQLAERRAAPCNGRVSEHRTRARRERIRAAAFGLVAVAVLAVGGYLAFGDLLGRRETVAGGNAISVQASMAGFTPAEIRVRTGEAVVLDFWTRDSSVHLERGVHTLINHELGLHAELPGADAVSTSRIIVQFTAPLEPGEYDIYCDTCCGGRDNPTMHGKVIVEA